MVTRQCLVCFLSPSTYSAPEQGQRDSERSYQQSEKLKSDRPASSPGRYRLAIRLQVSAEIFQRFRHFIDAAVAFLAIFAQRFAQFDGGPRKLRRKVVSIDGTDVSIETMTSVGVSPWKGCAR